MLSAMGKTAILLIGLVFGIVSHASTPPLAPLLEIEGRIYPVDAFPANCKDLFNGVQCKEASFGHYHMQAVKEGEVIYSKTEFAAPEGTQVIEQSWEKNGRVQKAKIENKVLAKTLELEVKNGRAYYRTTDQDGKIKTSDEEAYDNLVVPSTVMAYVRPHFQELMNDHEVNLHVAVLDRQEAFSFTMSKVKKESHGEILVLEMVPSSMIVRAFVSRMKFYINTKTNEFFAFEGRSTLKRKVGDSYRDLDVKASYEYKVNQMVPTGTQAAATSCAADQMFNPVGSKCEVKSE